MSTDKTGSRLHLFFDSALLGKHWLYAAAPLVTAVLYGISLGLESSNIFVSLDIYVFVTCASAIFTIIAFGAMRRMEIVAAEVLTPSNVVLMLTCLFLIPILEAFRLRVTNGTFMFGFVPWADAARYVFGGWQMLVDGTLSQWHQRRPINAAVMELRLLLSGFNLHALVLLNSAMLGLASSYAAIELEKHVGVLATAIFVLVLFGYAQPYVPSTLSEILGLSLGLIGCGALLRASRLCSVPLYVLGLALLSFALNARAGNYFVMPAVWLWGVIYLRHGLYRRIGVAVLGAAGLLAGFVYSLALIKIYGNGEVLSFNANFGDTLYGLARGGLGWQLAQREHPELYGGIGANKYADTDAARRFAALIVLSVEEIRSHPMRFIGVYFEVTKSALDHLAGGPELRVLDGRQYSTILSPIFKVLNVIGLLGLLRFAVARTNAMILLALGGFFLSIPFIWQDGGLRVLSATISFVFFPPAYGLKITGMFCENARWPAIREFLAGLFREPPTTVSRAFLLIPAGTLLGVSLIPFVLAGTAKRLDVSHAKPEFAMECPPDSFYLNITSGHLLYVMRVHPGAGAIHNSLSDVTFENFQASLSPLHIEQLFRKLPPPYTFIGTIIVMSGSIPGFAAGIAPERFGIPIVWPGVLKHFSADWDLCVEQLPESYTGYSGRVYKIVRQLESSGSH